MIVWDISKHFRGAEEWFVTDNIWALHITFEDRERNVMVTLDRVHGEINAEDI